MVTDERAEGTVLHLLVTQDVGSAYLQEEWSMFAIEESCGDNFSVPISTGATEGISSGTCEEGSPGFVCALERVRMESS